MKKLKLTLLTSLFLLLGFSTKAQSAKGQTVATLNVGYSLTGSFVKGLFTDGEGETSVKVSPVIILGADYGITDNFSLGFHFTTQGMKGTVKDNWYFNDSGNIVTENFDYTLRRTHFGLTPKFHFIKDNPKLDIYSGLRIGYVLWSIKSDSKDETFTVFDDLKGRITAGITPIGIRYYFTEQFGANFDLNIGAPYVASFGVNYKIGGSNY